jgi:hypothetical protein
VNKLWVKVLGAAAVRTTGPDERSQHCQRFTLEPSFGADALIDAWVTLLAIGSTTRATHTAVRAPRQPTAARSMTRYGGRSPRSSAPWPDTLPGTVAELGGPDLGGTHGSAGLLPLVYLRSRLLGVAFRWQRRGRA